MRNKKIISVILSICLTTGLSVKTAYAADDNGKIDLYQVFSSKADAMKTEVGSRIYKWSMHLPDDGVIYKSQQANYFSMSTTSYQSDIQLEIDKNKNNLTLEEYLYNLQNKPKNSFFYYDDDKEFSMSIQNDGTGKRYIRIIKADQIYDYYMVNEAAEESGNYIENRIYIENNYIYNLTVSMKTAYYKEHQEMFDKLISSFKISFDEKNPYIKELSDSVSTQRKFTNASYGWQITLNPYWKVDGIANARVQNFIPVYSDEELNMSSKDQSSEDDPYKVEEGVTVSLVNSAVSGETAESFGEKELNDFKSNYNSSAYDILSCGKKVQNNLDMYSLVIRNKTITGKPYVVHSLYVIGNGYKYIVSATMKDEKYNDAQKRTEFENMINSFALSRSNLSKYLGKIIPADSLININESKDFKLKKYSFGTKLTKGWDISDNSNTDYYAYNQKFMQQDYNGNITNSEYSSAVDPFSNINLIINAGLDASEINENIKKRAETLSADDEVLMGLAKVTIKSADYNDAKLYYVAKEYDLNSILNFVQSDKTKTYNFENLQNEYNYIIKIGNNTYTESITIPLSRTTNTNMDKIHKIWSDTSVNGTNYSKLNISWKDHKLDEYITNK